MWDKNTPPLCCRISLIFNFPRYIIQVKTLNRHRIHMKLQQKLGKGFARRIPRRICLPNPIIYNVTQIDTLATPTKALAHTSPYVVKRDETQNPNLWCQPRAKWPHKHPGRKIKLYSSTFYLGSMGTLKGCCFSYPICFRDGHFWGTSKYFPLYASYFFVCFELGWENVENF